MLLQGINHVAVLTGDLDRFVAFYRDVFDATSEPLEDSDGFRMALVWLGDWAELNVFEIGGNSEHERQVPMFGRGRLDHMALQAASIESFDEIRRRLMERGASDGFVTDFGHLLSVFFRDPDGLEAEVCVANPDADRELFAPTLLRSQVLALLHAEAAAGRIPRAEALAQAERACRLPRRLLGDSVLRRTAWNLAAEHGWADTYDAEYIALTRLHGTALVAGDDGLRLAAEGIVTVLTVDAFQALP